MAIAKTRRISAPIGAISCTFVAVEGAPGSDVSGSALDATRDDGSGLDEGAIDAASDGDAPADGCGAGKVIANEFATCGFATGIGWIDTYDPSQTIRFGAYRQGVKNPRNWLTESDLPGRMS